MARRADALASAPAPQPTAHRGLRLLASDSRPPAGRASGGRKAASKRTAQTEPSTDVPFVERVPLEYARCRSLGHSWQHRKTPYNPKEDGGSWQETMGAIGFVSVCDTCNTKRTKWVMRSGALGNTSYDYPDGYSSHGEDRLAPMDWRKSFVVRVFG